MKTNGKREQAQKKARQATAKWAKKNHKHCLEYARAWRKKHSDLCRKYWKKYYDSKKKNKK